MYVIRFFVGVEVWGTAECDAYPLWSQDAVKWLEANYNPQEYSLWKAEYKYPEELTQGSSLISSFFVLPLS